MARIIDQAPQYQDNNPEEPSENQGGLEQSPVHEPLRHVNTSLQDAYDQRILKGMGEDGSLNVPPHVPQGLVENPDAGGAREIIPADKKKNPWVKRGVATVAGALAIGVGIGVVHNNTEKSTPENTSSGANGADRTASAPLDVRTEKYPSRLPIADVTGDQFVGKDTMYPYTYSRQEQLDYAGTKLNTNMQATAERMRDRIGRQYSIFTGDDGQTTRAMAMPSLDNTPQQIWDQITVGSFQAWEAAQNGNIDEAKKLAAAVDDPEHREYTDEIKGFSNANAIRTNSEGVAWNEKPVIASGDYEGITATPTAPLIEFNVNIGGNDAGNRIKAVLRFEQGSTSDANRWVLVTTYDA